MKCCAALSTPAAATGCWSEEGAWLPKKKALARQKRNTSVIVCGEVQQTTLTEHVTHMTLREGHAQLYLYAAQQGLTVNRYTARVHRSRAGTGSPAALPSKYSCKVNAGDPEALHTTGSQSQVCGSILSNAGSHVTGTHLSRRYNHRRAATQNSCHPVGGHSILQAAVGADNHSASAYW